MKHNSLSFLFALVFVFSCGRGPSVEKDVVGPTTVDSTTIETSVPDPDSTDQIQRDQYLINSVSEKTAALVRDRLTSLHADDLKIGIVDTLSRKFIFFEFDLNGDNKPEIFVGLTGPYFCGTGGCTQFILDSEGKVITRFTVSDYPVVISRDQTNGWRDLYILSKGEYHIVQFDGKSYPSNPSILPKLGILPGDGLPRALDFLNDNYPWFKF